MSYIIALAGAAGAGKDTAADYLVSQYGFVKIAFADALREEAAAAFGVGIGQFLDRAKKDEPRYQFALSNCTDAAFVKVAIDLAISNNPSFTGTRDAAQNIALTAPRSPRQILQWWGTEYRRSQNDGYWLGGLSEKLDPLPETQSVVITDCRFVNEVNFVKFLSPDSEAWEVQRITVPYRANHASAIPLPGHLIDCIIDNNGTISALHQRISDYVATLTPAIPRTQQPSTAQAAIDAAQSYAAQEAAAAIDRMANAGYSYLASPYTAPAQLNPEERSIIQADRAHAAAETAMHLAKAGHAVYSPIAHGYALEVSHQHYTDNGDDTLTHAQWMKQCYPLLKNATCIVVLMIDGWDTSKGVALEMAYCTSHGIPVQYINPGSTELFNTPETAQTFADQAFAARHDAPWVLSPSHTA
jgi:Domain of unknown function (DUF1937)